MIEAALTVAFVTVLTSHAFHSWLKRPVLEIVQLRDEVNRLRGVVTMLDSSIEVTCTQWAQKFDPIVARVGATERAIEKIEPGQKFNPLGKHYSARG